MLRGQMQTTREQAVVERIQKPGGKRQFANFESGNFVSQLAELLAQFREAFVRWSSRTACFSGSTLGRVTERAQGFARFQNSTLFNCVDRSLDGNG